MKQNETTTRTVYKNRVQIDEHTSEKLVKLLSHYHGCEQTEKAVKK